MLIALRHLNEDLGLTIVLSEHRLERVVQYADRMLYLPALGVPPVLDDPRRGRAASARAAVDRAGPDAGLAAAAVDDQGRALVSHEGYLANWRDTGDTATRRHGDAPNQILSRVPRPRSPRRRSAQPALLRTIIVRRCGASAWR